MYKDTYQYISRFVHIKLCLDTWLIMGLSLTLVLMFVLYKNDWLVYFANK